MALMGTVMLVLLGIVGAAVGVGFIEKNKKPIRGRGGKPLTDREKINLAKVAGVMPQRKEN